MTKNFLLFDEINEIDRRAKIEDEFQKHAKKFYNLVLNKIEINSSKKLKVPPKNSLEDPITFLVNYGLRTKQIDRILHQIGTRKICADKSKCNQHTNGEYYGCCSRGFYNSGILGLNTMQKVEAQRNGWRDHEKNFCEYLSPSGCKLFLFKSPICIGFLCSGIEKILSGYGKDGQNFNFAMSFIKCGVPEMEKYSILRAMDDAIKYGKLIVSQKN